MASFLTNIAPFLGNGQKDEQGRTLEQFLEEYDPRKYELPAVTADILVFRRQSAKEPIKLLLIKRRNHPGIGMWALPGGFAEMKEDLIDSARRELKEETSLDNVPVEQLRVWGNYNRDPRCRLITVSHLAFIEGEGPDMAAGDDAADACWMDVSLEALAEEEYGNKKKTAYLLKLANKEKKLFLSARVACMENKEGILKEEEFHVLEQSGIAFDHPCMIVHALRVLAERGVNASFSALEAIGTPPFQFA